MLTTNSRWLIEFLWSVLIFLGVFGAAAFVGGMG